MLLDLNKLHGPREHVERTLQASALGPDDPEYRVVGPIDLVMDVAKIGADAFEVTGRVRSRLELACSRCLEPYEIPVDASFELRYVPHSENVGPPDSDEREIEEDDLTTAYYKDGVLDIGDLLREQ